MAKSTKARTSKKASTGVEMEQHNEFAGMRSPIQTAANRENMSNVNVGTTERYLSILGGLGMMYAAMRRRDWRSFAMAFAGSEMIYRGATGHCYVYDKLGVSTAVKTNADNVSVPHEQGIHVSETVTIDRPVEDIFAFWRNFENLPQFMNHLESVTYLPNGNTHWVAKAPLGTKVEWDAEIVNEVRNEVIGWRSLKDSQIANAGAVRFSPAPGNQGTQVRVELEYVPPAGSIGAAVAAFLGEEPSVQVRDDLQRLKNLMETSSIGSGDIPTAGENGV
jgi:uncharacterized membrane protein